MEEAIQKMQAEALAAIDAAQDEDALERIRVTYMGKKSRLVALTKGIKDLDDAQKRVVGPIVQKAKQAIVQALTRKREELETARDAQAEWIDVTAPGTKVRRGHLHPLTLVQRDIENIFTTMGFAIVDGPEVETEFYNFDAVNVPKEHPARDMQDTFWIQTANNNARQVLRTHTTSVQVRYMQQHTPPFRIIIPGRVFRQEATDSTHEHTFHQFEALVVGDDVSVANFLDIAQSFFSAFFKKDIKVRLRPSYFPFVEPGFEFDINCTKCGGPENAKGCSACKGNGWLEIGGAGMVHQNVFVAAGYKRNRYQGFAWGFGLERLAMMKYKIDDIRHFHSGDVRVGAQFR